MRPYIHRHAQQSGFTLVEAIVAIVLLGIVAGMVAVFIRAPLQGYKDSKVRAELTDLADLSLRRIARDLRLALPNSIRTNGVNGTTIEFLLTKSGGRYLATEDASPTGIPLSFDDASQRSFTVLGSLAGGRAAIVEGDMLVINNQSSDPDTAPANAYLLASANRNITTITKVTAPASDMPTLELFDNPFASQSPSMPSESARFQVVSGPVTYHCQPGANGTGTLHRQWNYAITETQAVPPVPTARPASWSGAQSQPLIKGVETCSFDYQVDKSGRGGLVILKLELRVPDENAMIRLVHQVHVDNTP